MSNILIKPPQIRNTSSQLRSHAKIIQTAFDRIDQIITELSPARFEGLSSSTFRMRYSLKKGSIQKASEKVIYFAQTLEQIAQKFEEADKALKNASNSGQVLGLSSIAGDLLEKARFANFSHLNWKEKAEVLKRLHLELEDLQERLNSSRSIEDLDKEINNIQAKIAEINRLKEEATAGSKNWLNQVIPDWPLERDTTDGAPWRVKADDFDDEIAEYDRQLAELDQQQRALVEERELRISNQERFDEVQSQYTSAKDQVLTEFTGNSYSPTTAVKNQGLPTNAPLTNTSEFRDPDIYDAVLNQFGVETNPRYTPKNGDTYCNIYVWDATKAMGAEIPHWVNSAGEPVAVATGKELNANGVVDWLENHGQDNGWRAISASEAQEYANSGKPTVAVWENPSPGDPGHVAMVRPGGDYNPSTGPTIAQAGGKNLNESTVSQRFSTGWKNDQVLYYVHE